MAHSREGRRKNSRSRCLRAPPGLTSPLQGRSVSVGRRKAVFPFVFGKEEEGASYKLRRRRGREKGTPAAERSRKKEETERSFLPSSLLHGARSQAKKKKRMRRRSRHLFLRGGGQWQMTARKSTGGPILPTSSPCAFFLAALLIFSQCT